MTTRKKIASLPLIRPLTSVKTVVICLLFLFILTFWGTIDQVEHGLYAAQQKFFYSIFFLAFGFLPFPGAQLILWILFIHLVAVLIFRFSYRRNNVGILIIHFGLFLVLVSAFVTFYFAQESHVTLMEGEGSNISTAYHNWELSVWTQSGNTRKVVAFDSDRFKAGEILKFDEDDFDVIVETYYPNSEAYTMRGGNPNTTFLNASEISSIKEAKKEKEPEKNFPGGIFHVKKGQQELAMLILYGGETDPTILKNGNESYYFMLRRKRFELPFVLQLADFRMDVHPGTEVARSYESEVEIETPDSSRRTVIFMNNPLRHKDYTFYQASYSIDPFGREASTLAVVKNIGRILPYISTIVTVLGLVTHFAMMFLQLLNRKKT